MKRIENLILTHNIVNQHYLSSKFTCVGDSYRGGSGGRVVGIVFHGSFISPYPDKYAAK